MNDAFSNYTDTPQSPAARAMAVTPDDAVALPFVPKALYIGTGGTITMRGVGDQADSVWRNIPDGAILPFRSAFVRMTGTTPPTSSRWARHMVRFGLVFLVLRLVTEQLALEIKD